MEGAEKATSARNIDTLLPDAISIPSLAKKKLEWLRQVALDSSQGSKLDFASS